MAAAHAEGPLASPPPTPAAPRSSSATHTSACPHACPHQDPFFRPWLGSLVKLVFLSSAIHQLAFAALSSLPFAVGEPRRESSPALSR